MPLNNLFPKKDLIIQYRNVFSHSEARHVLYSMLFDLGFFNENVLPENLPLRNYATRLLNILGAGEIKMNAVDNLVNGLKSNPLPEEIKQETF